MTREGLALIGVPQDLVLRHNCPRLIYGVRLAKNSFEYLRGDTSEPDYVFPPTRSREGTEAIVNHWIQRWFLPRSGREESLGKVERFNKEELRLGREISADGGPGEDHEPEELPHVRIG